MMNCKSAQTICLKLSCLCLIVASIAFTMGNFASPLFPPSPKPSNFASQDPSPEPPRQINPLPEVLNIQVTDTPRQAEGEALNNQTAESSQPSQPAISALKSSPVPKEEAALENKKSEFQIPSEPGARHVQSSEAEAPNNEATESSQPSISTLKSSPTPKEEAALENKTSESQIPSEPGKDCEISEGTWVEDDAKPLYENKTCPLITQSQNCPGNGRPDTGYLNWRGKPNECELPRFNGTTFLELIRGKTLAFIGDSLTRNHYESLMCTLWQVTKPHFNGNKKFQRWLFRDYNVKIVRVWSSWLVCSSTESIDFEPKDMINLHLKELDDNISEFLPSFDIIVVASGHWWCKTSAYVVDGKVVGGNGWWNAAHKMQYDLLSGYAIAMQSALNAIISNPNYKGLTILRTFSPHHYEGGAWNTGGSCTGKTKPLTDKELAKIAYMDTVYRHQLAAAAEHERTGRASAKKLKVMDVTRPFAYRADGHPGPNRSIDARKQTRKKKRGEIANPTLPQDCLHWCMPGPIDAWNQFLFNILRREIPSHS